MSDSDETVGPGSDVSTLPSSDNEDRCFTPDLFEDSPDESKTKMVASKPRLNTSHSRAHDLSESDSDDGTANTYRRDSKPKISTSSPSPSKPNKTSRNSPSPRKPDKTSRNSPSPRKLIKTSRNSPSQNKDSDKRNSEKHSSNVCNKSSPKQEQRDSGKKYSDSKSYSPKPGNKPSNKLEQSSEKNGTNKKRFMDDFLNMTDSNDDSDDDEFLQNKKKLDQLKQKHTPRKKEHASSNSIQDVNGRSNHKEGLPTRVDERFEKSTEKKKPTHLDKPHKKDYSKPHEQNNSPQSNSSSKHSKDIGSYLKKKDREDSDNHSPGSIKRKRSKSPVPQELRKAVTQILNENSSNSAKKRKPLCQYGTKCYRKNPTHFEEFSHPGDDDYSPSQKKRKLETNPSSSSRTDSPSSYTAKDKKIKPESPSMSRSDSPSTSKVMSRTPSSSKVKTNSPLGSMSRSDTPSISKVISRTPSSSKVTSQSPSMSRTESPSTSKVKFKTHSPTSDCKVTSRPGMNPKTIQEKLQQAEPYGLFLTKVSGISDKYNNTYCMDITDLLSPSMGNLEASCQFNFMFDIPWLMKQYPPQFRKKPLLIVHGEQGASKNALQGQGLPYENIKFCQAKLDMMYGTHHTKMMLLLYDNGLRVIIHTSNLIQQDWYQKTQGMWISPVFPKLSEPSKDKGDSVTHFKRDLLEYMQAYKAYQLKEWMDHVTRHDMSSARVVIIGSTPGRHTDRAKSMWGHMKLRKVLQEHGPSHETVKSWPAIGQFSSIGSMGPHKDNWLCAEWKQSLATTKTANAMPSNTRLLLIFPSRHNVRLSLEGYPAGGSIPYTAKTAQKQLYLNDFFHVWKSEGRGRSRAMPHIKSYCRAMQDGSKAAWFIVTSSNLSKAAWGALEKKGVQLMIRSYEIGVMFLPKFFDEGETFPVTSDPELAATSNRLLLPYDLPPTIYDKKDRPWMWDIPYMDLPDTNGNVWCPFSK